MSDPLRSDVDPARLRPGRDADLIPSGLDDQSRLVAEAILLVSRGGAPRVTITGLRDGDLILDASRSLAAASGVRLISLPTGDGGGADVRVEPLDLVGAESSDRVGGVVRAFRSLRSIRVALAQGPDQGA